MAFLPLPRLFLGLVSQQCPRCLGRASMAASRPYRSLRLLSNSRRLSSVSPRQVSDPVPTTFKSHSFPSPSSGSTVDSTKSGLLEQHTESLSASSSTPPTAELDYPSSLQSAPSSSATPTSPSPLYPSDQFGQTTTATTTAKPRRSRLRPRKAAIVLTAAAVEKLRSLLRSPTPRMIRVGVKNRGCSGLAYHLEYVQSAGQYDEVVEQDGVKVLVDSKALFSIIGSQMDWHEDRLSQKFVFKNPNITEQCGCGESFSTGA